MSIKREKKQENKIVCKGTLQGITANGIVLVDDKEGDTEVLTFEELKTFVDKSISISIAEQSKEEVEKFETDEEEDSEDEE